MAEEPVKKKVNKLNLLIAIVIAVAGWLYVVYNVNPTMTRTFNDVPIKVSNENVLSENDLAVASLSKETTSVTLRARRSVLDSMKTSDILVNADVSEAGKGNNKIALVVTAPADATVTKQGDQNVTVKVEDRVKKKVAARTVFMNSSDDDAEPMVTEQSKDEIEVSGAKSLVANVGKAILPLNSKKVTGREKAFSVKARAVDKSGNAVEFVKCSPSRLSVKAVKSTKKTVKLVVNVTGQNDDDYDRTYTAPDTIVIKGKPSDLKNVDSITADTVDLSGVTSDQTIRLTFSDLPDGIKIAKESADVSIRVKVNGSSTKSFTVPGSSVSVSGLGSNMHASVSGSVTVTAKGKSSTLNSLSAGSFGLSVNVSGMSAGTYNMTPTLSDSGAASNATVSGSVTVTITDNNSGDSSTTGDSNNGDNN